MTREEVEKRILSLAEEIRHIVKDYTEELGLPEQNVHVSVLDHFYQVFSIIHTPGDESSDGLYLLEFSADKETCKRKRNRMCNVYEGVLKEGNNGK